MTHTIFVIDDDSVQLELTQQILQKRLGYRTIAAQGGKEAIERFLLRIDPKPDLLLVDLMMPEVNGIDVIRAVRRSDKHLPIIVLSAYGSMDQALEAVRAGANDFLLKPANIERLRLSIHNLLHRAVLTEELDRVSRQKDGQANFSDIIGQHASVLHAISRARQAAESTIPMLIQGERGVGKELLAHAIHGSSSRSGKQMKVINCFKQSDEVIRGMFQSWLSPVVENDARISALGTLCLKQVSALTPDAQNLLLELLQQKSSHHHGPQFRLICTNQEPLIDAMQAGHLREDLYYRLSALTIDLPPLRERQEDLMILAERYLQSMCASEDRSITSISVESKQLLRQYEWPGNIRELQHIIYQAVIQCDGQTILPRHLTTLVKRTGGVFISEWDLATSGDGGAANGLMSLITKEGNIKPIHELEAELIQYAIRHYKGKMSEVARRLGIGRSTLYRKIQDYQIDQVA